MPKTSQTIALALAGWFLIFGFPARAQTVSIDTSAAGRQQTIDGFGTCLSGNEALQSWWQDLFLNDLQASIVRMDLTPAFKSPYSDFTCNSPWFHNNPPLPGPDNNNVRTYTGAADYSRLFAGRNAPIAVMGPDIDQNTNYFVFPAPAGTIASLGMARTNQLGDFKLIASLWSPAPWVKVTSSNSISGQSGILPVNGTAWPFIWGGNYAGGKLDTSGTPLAVFDDTSLGGTGPTSALTQFTRCLAAYVHGFQNAYHVKFYALSIQNELGFEEFYNSCVYPQSSSYITALKAVRTEFDAHPDLAGIKLMGPEDVLGGDGYGMWQYGGGSSPVQHKNLQFLKNVANDSQAAAAEAFFCIHGYAANGVSAADATPTSWQWWANGWSASPGAGLPTTVSGFNQYHKKSWMTETSGEDPAWLSPASGFPGAGAWSLALRIHQALTAGNESAWVYWQLTDGNAVGQQTLTDSTLQTNSAKFVAAKHFFRYIRPGAVRVNAMVTGATNMNASAYVHDTNGTLTVVLVNGSASPATTSLNVPSQPTGITSLRTFISSNGSYWQNSKVTITNGVAVITVPGYGVATLYGVTPPSLQAAVAAAGQLTLSWPQAGAGFVLQTASGLNPPGNWTTFTNNFAISNGVATVMVPTNAVAQYYRLLLPP